MARRDRIVSGVSMLTRISVIFGITYRKHDRTNYLLACNEVFIRRIMVWLYRARIGAILRQLEILTIFLETNVKWRAARN